MLRALSFTKSFFPDPQPVSSLVKPILSKITDLNRAVMKDEEEG